VTMKCVKASLAASLMMAVYLLTVSTGAALAQQQNNLEQNQYTDLSRYLLSGSQVVPQQTLTSPANLSSTVTQIGQGNIANAALSGTSNVTIQYQLGSQNSSTLSANGAQNTLATSQIGNGNSTSISVNGNGNNISNLQVGSGLTYQLQIVGSSAPISVQQYGRR